MNKKQRTKINQQKKADRVEIDRKDKGLHQKSNRHGGVKKSKQKTYAKQQRSYPERGGTQSNCGIMACGSEGMDRQTRNELNKDLRALAHSGQIVSGLRINEVEIVKVVEKSKD